jgi:hypothetical protein
MLRLVSSKQSSDLIAVIREHEKDAVRLGKVPHIEPRYGSLPCTGKPPHVPLIPAVVPILKEHRTMSARASTKGSKGFIDGSRQSGMGAYLLLGEKEERSTISRSLALKVMDVSVGGAVSSEHQQVA